MIALGARHRLLSASGVGFGILVLLALSPRAAMADKDNDPQVVEGPFKAKLDALDASLVRMGHVSAARAIRAALERPLDLADYSIQFDRGVSPRPVFADADVVTELPNGVTATSRRVRYGTGGGLGWHDTRPSDFEETREVTIQDAGTAARPDWRVSIARRGTYSGRDPHLFVRATPGRVTINEGTRQGYWALASTNLIVETDLQTEVVGANGRRTVTRMVSGRTRVDDNVRRNAPPVRTRTGPTPRTPR